MIQIDEEEEINLCVNCDAEYIISRVDGDKEEPTFCPYCGYDINSDEDFFDEEEY